MKRNNWFAFWGNEAEKEITLDELRALADADLQKEFGVQKVADSTEREQEEEIEPVVVAKVRHEIDLGDGSGKQVFEADNWEALAGKLAEAQTHATRKIREQNRLLKERETAEAEKVKKAETSVLTPEQEFLLYQDFQKSPTAAFRRMFEAQTGMTPEQFKDTQKEVAQTVQEKKFEAASVAFVEATPDYNPIPSNGKKMLAYMRVNGMAGTVEDMEKAFTELTADGLLVPRTDAQDANEETDQPERARIENTGKESADTERNADGTFRKKVSSGLSAKRGMASRATKAEPTLEELEKMPLKDLERLAQRDVKKAFQTA